MKEKLEKLKELRTEVEKCRNHYTHFEDISESYIKNLFVKHLDGDTNRHYLECDFKIIDGIYACSDFCTIGSGISHIVYGDYLYFVDAGVICKEV